MGVLAGLIEDGVRSGGFRPVPVALVVQVTDAAHARLRDPGVLADLGVTHAAAIDALTGILLDGIAGRGAVTPRPADRTGLRAVELPCPCPVQEARPLKRGVAVRRAVRVLGIAHDRPVLQVRDLDATTSFATRSGLEPGRPGQLVRCRIGRERMCGIHGFISLAACRISARDCSGPGAAARMWFMVC